MAIDKAVDSSVLDASFTAIANAIRAKNGLADTYTPGEMADAIAAIDTEAQVPAYWKTTLQTKIAAINTLRAGIVNPFSTVFLTDVHLEDNNGQSPALIREVMLRTGANSAVCGGDLIVRQSTKAEASALIADWVKRTKGLNMVQLCGNHDLNSEPQNSGAGWMTYAEWFALVSGSAEDITWYTHTSGDVTGFGYRLHPAEKICEVFLNTGANSDPSDDYHFSTALAWAYDYVKTLTSEWGVIIYAHKFWQPTGHMVEQNPAQYIKSYLVARKNSISAEIIALVTGHCHDDYYTYDPDMGYLILSTTCDAGTAQAALDEINQTRTPGTTLEQAFDVLTVDRTNKLLYATRIGAGSDRVLSYVDNSTYTVTNNLTNATNSNNAAQVAAHDSYSATISAAQGYSLQSITVEMGGVDVTAYVVAGGVITIADVTGNIVITAVAAGVTPTWTNLIPTAVAAGSYTTRPIYNSVGYKDGQYLSNTNASHEGGADAGCTLTGMIPYSYADFVAGKTIYVSGLSWTGDSHCRMTFVGSNGIECNPYINRNIDTYFTKTEYATYWTLTPKAGAMTNTGATWVQFSLMGSGAGLSIGVM